MKRSVSFLHSSRRPQLKRDHLDGCQTVWLVTGRDQGLGLEPPPILYAMRRGGYSERPQLDLYYSLRFTTLTSFPQACCPEPDTQGAVVSAAAARRRCARPSVGQLVIWWLVGPHCTQYYTSAASCASCPPGCARVSAASACARKQRRSAVRLHSPQHCRSTRHHPEGTL